MLIVKVAALGTVRSLKDELNKRQGLHLASFEGLHWCPSRPMRIATVPVKGRKLKPHAVVICLSLVLAGVASQAAGARSSSSASEGRGVRAVLVQEIVMFNGKRWELMWQMYSQRVRSHCSYRRFVRVMRSIRSTTGPVTLRSVTVRVSGRSGFARYSIVSNGRLIGGATAKKPDVYTRVSGRWFDDFDADGLCPSDDRPS